MKPAPDDQAGIPGKGGLALKALTNERVSTYRYTFRDEIKISDVKESLLLAAMAAESLHGRSRVHLDASFHLDEAGRTCVIDAGTEVGQDIAGIFTGYLTREFGEDAFQLERAPKGLEE
jgi:hypothetical protein